MAEVVDSMPNKQYPPSKLAGISKYNQYLDGQIWKLKRGVDAPESKSACTRMTQCMREIVLRRGQKLSVRIHADAVYVQVTDRPRSNDSL